MPTYSPLTGRTMPTTKRSDRRGVKIRRVIVHHWAGINGGIERLVHSSDKASANYLILSTGEIIGSVPEEYRAWTSGSHAADGPSITIEVQNSTLGPEWKIAPAARAALTRLIADIADRCDWPEITRDHVRGHREFAASLCPGPFLWPILPVIAKDAQALRATSAPKSAPKTVAQMAIEIIAGRHGNGHDNRRRSLGVDAATYAAVRAEVNRRLK